MTYPSPPAAPDLELGAHDDAYTTDRDPTATMLCAETDAMRLEATTLGIPDTVEGLLAFAMREVAALRIAVRALRGEVDGLRVECAAATEALNPAVEALASEAAQLKLRVRKLEGEL